MNLFNIFNFKKNNLIIKEISENDRIIGSLYGFFVGDALGVPVEFNSRELLKNNPIKDMTEYGTHNQPKGTWSDDSSMVLATMDSMVNNKDIFLDDEVINYGDLMERFLEWKLNAKYTPNNSVFDIGISTSYSLDKYLKNKDNIFCGIDDINSNGNGSLMRILPVSLYTKYCIHSTHAFCIHSDNYDVIKNVSSLTHSHILSVMSCYIYSFLITKYLEVLDIDRAYKSTRNHMKDIFNGIIKKDYGDLECCKKYFNRLIYDDISLVKEDDIKSSGFVVDTLEASIWCVLTSNSYKEAVLKAINLGNDTDTIGALTGALAGLVYGINNIPVSWLNQLQRKDYLAEMIGEYLELLELRMEKNIKEKEESIVNYKEKLKKHRNIKATRDSWKVIPMAGNIKELDINILLSNDEMSLVKLGHVPLEMGDHWFMYVDESDNSINYYRSWTGIQVFRGYYKEEDNTLIYKLIINKDKGVYSDRLKDNDLVEEFNKLIKSEIEYHK